MNEDNDQLMKPLIALLGRSVFPRDDLIHMVAPAKGKAKQIRAFNLCDGTRSQSQIPKQLSLDRGNFSRTVARWIEAGIVFRLGEGRDGRLLHVYPLTLSNNGNGNGKSKMI